MRILFHSPAFLPLVGGLEIHVATLAQAFAQRGHQVAIWTTTPASASRASLEPAGYRVLRRPSPWAALRAVRWCDVFFHANISLHGVWPLAIVRRPWVVSHQSWYCRTDGRVAWQDRLKRWALRFADGSISVSQAIANDLATPSEVIPDAYQDHLFRTLVPELPRDVELAFVGRLVSDKGVDLLLEALARIAAGGSPPRLTIVGDGPERQALEQLARDRGLSGRVDFLGIQTGETLVRTLNRHQILVVPSRYDEPFGIVALEGIACGCAVIGTAGGGLPEAIGPCGRVVPNRDVTALAQAIVEVLGDEDLRRRYRAAAPAHLSAHSAEVIGERTLRVLARVGGREARG